MKLTCTSAWFGVPDTLDMTRSTELLDVNVLAAVQLAVAGVALLTAIALHPVTPVPPIRTSAAKDGVLPFV